MGICQLLEGEKTVMIINFNAITEQTLPAQHGAGEMTVKFFADGVRKVIPTRLQPRRFFRA